MSVRREADWLTVDRALARILAACGPLADEEVPIGAAAGRVLAERVVARVAHPPWDNSGMDGFAVRSDDVRGATAGRPARLRVVEDIPAGHVPTVDIGPGQAARIMTGAQVPNGADGVIRVEHTDAWQRGAGAPLPERVDVLRDDDAGRNIRRRGEDVQPGAAVMDAGDPLTPARIGVLAMVGRERVRVRRRPRVAILSTGDELAGPDRLDEVRAGRAIADSNSPALAAALAAAGCEPIPLGVAPDRLDAIRERLDAARDADALITTAGASVGEHDLVKDALEAAGYELDFWRVRMRPGSPFSFGRLDGRPVFGVAGNPVSALVTFEVLVRPALRAMLGLRRVHSAVVTARCGEAMRSKPELAHFLRVRLERAAVDGAAVATLTGAQGSGILTSIADADGLLVVPEGSTGLAEGATARVMPLNADAAAADRFLLWPPPP